MKYLASTVVRDYDFLDIYLEAYAYAHSMYNDKSYGLKIDSTTKYLPPAKKYMQSALTTRILVHRKVYSNIKIDNL